MTSCCGSVFQVRDGQRLILGQLAGADRLPRRVFKCVLATTLTGGDISGGERRLWECAG